MKRALHSSNPRLPLVLAALSAGLFLSGCSGANDPATIRPELVSGTAPAAPDSSVTSTTLPVPTSTRPVATTTTTTTSAAPTADLAQSLAGIDRDLAEFDHQLTDADRDVATPEGDIR